jgi:dihydrofolate reductase
MNAIVCMNSLNGIGKNGHIPWLSRIDMKYFKERTIGNGNNAVIMGFKTFASLNFRPLPNRRNYILTNNVEKASIKYKGDVVFENCIDNLVLLPYIFEEVYVIGGEQTYKIFEPFYEKLYVNIIGNSYYCDTFFTVDLEQYKKTKMNTTFDNLQKLTFYEFSKIHENSLAESFL